MIGFRLNLGPLDRILAAVRKPDLRPAWREARVPLRADIKDHRKRQEGPDGKWPARKSVTKKRSRSGRRARPRKLLGKLPTALRTVSDRRRVALISRVAWSDVHKSGGRAGHGANIPKRDFLWASSEALEAIGYIVARYVADVFNGKRRRR